MRLLRRIAKYVYWTSRPTVSESNEMQWITRPKSQSRYTRSAM